VKVTFFVTFYIETFSIEIIAKGCILLEAKLLFRLMVGSTINLQSIEADKLAILEGEQEIVGYWGQGRVDLAA